MGKWQDEAADWQHHLEYLATDLSDMVEDRICDAHSEIGDIADQCEGNTLLYGEEFDPKLLPELVSAIGHRMSIEAYAVVYTLNGVICDSDGECKVFPTPEQAQEHQAKLFHQIADERDWCTDATQADCMTLEMMNENAEEELLIVTVKLELGI